MTESAAPIEHVRSDALPPITPAQAAAFQEACAAAAAIHSARELGVIARISEAPADPAAVATYCGLTPQGASQRSPASTSSSSATTAAFGPHTRASSSSSSC